MAAAMLGLTAVAQSAEPPAAVRVARVNNASPEFRVPADSVSFWMNHTGYAWTNADRSAGNRFLHEEIGAKALAMIDAADTQIILSLFLFDSFYATQPSDRDIAGELARALIRKRREAPAVHIALILDPSHEAYGRRVSPVEKDLRDNGVDVFYSDLLSGLKKAGFVGVREGLGTAGRGMDALTFNGWSALRNGVLGLVPLPMRFDDETLSLEAAYNASLMKANHRKLLVCDVAGQDWEALVTSANPHNPSAYHVNTAIAVRGNPARYVYNLLREDLRQSLSLGGEFVHLSAGADRDYRRHLLSDAFPELDIPAAQPAVDAPALVRIVTESAIRDGVLELLSEVQPEDEVRIQMFYLSFQPVLDGLLEASRVVKQPIRILLDANKDSFNKVKDGTPNRQVAAYLLREARRLDGLIDIRWYSTHGEQNHAKAMSLTSTRTGRCRFTTGSANWTGRNLDGVNMEANVIVENAPAVNRNFNALFDRFWTNSDSNEYSLAYETFREAAPDAKWRRGEKPWYLNTF